MDLQPELWNNDNTILTLWLDPGRIKRDLQPNKTMGEPLQQASQYLLLIKSDWQGIDGLALRQGYSKTFIVDQRDTLSPNPELWKIQVPKAGTRQSLQINFGEMLDYVLLHKAISIEDDEGNRVPGLIEIKDNESVLYFRPSSAWEPSTYLLVSESRLEDLAGNNLNRVFDPDITLIKSDETKEVYKRTFYII